MGGYIVGLLATIGALTIAGFALVAAIAALKDRSRKHTVDLDAELAMLTHRPGIDRLPVADALHLIRARTSRERNQWN